MLNYILHFKYSANRFACRSHRVYKQTRKVNLANCGIPLFNNLPILASGRGKNKPLFIYSVAFAAMYEVDNINTTSSKFNSGNPSTLMPRMLAI